MNEEIEIKKIEEEIKRKHLLREYEILKAKEAEKLMELPFYLRIQDPSHKERLQKLEKIQEEVMNHIIKKHYPSLKGQEKDLFAEFFTEFLNGEVKSINHFFEKRKMPRKEWRDYYIKPEEK